MKQNENRMQMSQTLLVTYNKANLYEINISFISQLLDFHCLYFIENNHNQSY